MADRKSGRVKPPVIDLTARKRVAGAADKAAGKASARSESAAAAADPASSPAAASGSETLGETGSEFVTEPPKPAEPRAGQPPPRPPARLAMPWSAISIAAIGGALLGTGLTYLLASWIALPASGPGFDDPAPVLAEQAARISQAEQRVAAAEETAREARAGLDASVTELRNSLVELRAAIPEPTSVDLSGIEGQLRTLEGRIDAIGAGASTADAGTLADSLVAMEQALADLSTRMGEMDRRAAATDAAIADLAAEQSATKAAIAARNLSLGESDLAPAVKLPLVVSGLETAFATGRPFAAELESLRSILPDIDVPAAVEAAATAGLSRPDDLASRFAATVPDILAGRAHTPGGDWPQVALEWAKGLLALRPVGEMEGDTPEAIVSRLEAAMRRHDFVAARALLARLPDPMQRAAGSLAGEIAAHAEATDFIARLRAQALSPATAAEASP